MRTQLERILASQTLAGSDQLKRLLRLTVERKINDQSELLKEYNLGLEVFQRPPDYDPKIDPIVRVQARRLRSKLDTYYAGEGSGDSLIIHIPRGAYIPAFDYRTTTAPEPAKVQWIRLAAAGAGILVAILLVVFALRKVTVSAPDVDRSVAVLPLKSFVSDTARSYLPDEATEVLTTELAKSKQLRVLSRTTAGRYRDPSASLPDIARTLGVRWIVEGGVGSEGSRIYVKLRAVDATTDRKIWADVYDYQLGQVVDANARAAAKIVAAIESQLSAKR